MGLSSTMAMAALSRLFLPCALLLIPLILYFQCSLPSLNLAAAPKSSNLAQNRRFSAGMFLIDRGTSLLHSWSDEELFDRAMAMHNATALPEQIHSPRLLGVSHKIFKKFENDLGVTSAANAATAAAAAPPVSKVAFLFLTTGAIPFEPLWNRYFRGHEDLYNIYVHADPFQFRAFNRSSAFWGRMIPSDRTERGAPSLVLAMKRLLANALVDDPENQFFAMISDSCIPLHGFHRLHKRLAASPRKSFLEIITQSDLLWSRYNARGEGSMLPELQFGEFAVGSQWFVVTRDHARLLVGERRLWNKFRAPCLPEFAASSCYTEEHYFSTVMRVEDQAGSHGFTLTNVKWAENNDGHPTMYRAEEIDLGFLHGLQEESDGRFMFARKFHADCLDPLLRYADALLKH
ncbi:uncharacterized protein LOC9657604 [Selaginella moellendorffii]|nr:uncharacterized protein LOC9657604 [Selaginella moellendorffii]|eukprot:XP_002980842.2 uncharacterized protein LOC9657604 [Selaginella moellendorffii]